VRVRAPGKQPRQELAMESTQKKSSNSRVHRSDRIKQIFALVSMVGFGGSAIFGIVSLFGSGLSSQHQQKAGNCASFSGIFAGGAGTGI
jgi:hypothetical protein